MANFLKAFKAIANSGQVGAKTVIAAGLLLAFPSAVPAQRPPPPPPPSYPVQTTPSPPSPSDRNSDIAGPKPQRFTPTPVVDDIGGPAAESPPTQSVFVSLGFYITKVSHLDLPGAAGLWRKMDADATSLKHFADRHRIPYDYAMSVSGLTKALKVVVKDSDLSDGQKVSICKAVSQDLATKLTAAKKKPDDPFANVHLSVRTTDGVTEKSGYEVWYVPEAWDGTKQRYGRFPKLSSPTTEQIPPGYYSMWTKRKRQQGEQKPVTVQDTDGANQAVDLPVPAGN